ncbi:class I SAM-dependent methyltransferase [Sphingosinicella sp. LHD-64]|uniref:class I SAM-dependent methyltransferase n=1 Tax=Sphingosinicella sp. LHD-64 TaxID=3072139 RepID=UPI00280D70AC|nr:class I SAM-dependent methyltransferase [Sphingosinicella sp. LHD-64]MDQ8757222.1 class I SAM-dependent methyltransferase [Sphingosinicella sp. LHD-64]
MSLDIAQWSQQLHISNFANAYAEFRDVASLGNVSRILVIGPGQGLDCAVFRWRGYQVTTLDIDDRLNPDFIGSAHDLSMFEDKSFDVVIASHVLEHLPPAYLDRAIAELARVAHHALVYLPVGGRIMRFRVMPGLLGWDWTIAMHLCNPFYRPDPGKPRFCEGEHYWEIGRPGYSRRKVAARFEPHFRIRSMYWNPDWIMSFNFVLSAR